MKLGGLAARLLGDRRGVSAIEFGFIAPLLAILVVGIIDFGMGLWDDMQVAQAADAGAAYAAVHGWSTTASSIESAMTNATNLGSSITTTPAPSIINCSNSPTVGPCADGGQGNYWQVSANYSYSTIVPWPGVTRPMTLTSVAYARLYP